jgi:hypothetical protein
MLNNRPKITPRMGLSQWSLMTPISLLYIVYRLVHPSLSDHPIPDHDVPIGGQRPIDTQVAGHSCVIGEHQRGHYVVTRKSALNEFVSMCLP